MSKKHFIALAKQRAFGANAGRMSFSTEEINALADFCQQQNSNFNRQRWIAYINGECGKNGGAVKAQKAA
jgi:hypothetical protein